MLVTQVEKHVRSVFAAHAGPAVDDDGGVFVHALKAGGFDGADGFDGYVDGSGDVPVSIFACGADVYKGCGVFAHHGNRLVLGNCGVPAVAFVCHGFLAFALVLNCGRVG